MFSGILKRTKFAIDVLWNAVAFGGIVLIGILLNVLIVVFYDEEALGVFNQTYAIYIFLSQLAVGGVHLAIQFYTPKNAHSRPNLSILLTSALMASICISALIITLAYFAIPAAGWAMDSQNVELALYFTLWGLLFFSINKILLSFHNGLRNMRTFALFQFLRFFFILICLVIFMMLHLQTYYLPASLAIAECFLSIFLVLTSYRYLQFSFSRKFRKIFFLQIRYGRKALVGNVLLDLNTRVDVITLGIFLSDQLVGLYSFAATIFEGMAQIAVVFRNNLNPILTRAFLNKMLFERVVRMNRNTFYKMSFLMTLPAIAAFPVVAYIFGISDILSASIVFAILSFGFLITAGYQPLLMALNQIGQPAQQTMLISSIFLTNVILNLILIPFFGIIGAAVATACSFLVLFIYLKIFFRKTYGIRI